MRTPACVPWFLAAILCVGLLVSCGPSSDPAGWTDEEVALLRSLSLAALPPLPLDPSNSVADRPEAAALGRQLFFDTRFSADGTVSCASCHMPDHFFTDARPFGVGVGVIPLNTMSLVGASYSEWQTWDGKNDSQWSQALIPLENPLEHGGTRAQYAQVIAEHYRAEYAALFGPLPDLADRQRFPLWAGPVADPVAAASWAAMAAADQDAVNRIFANIGKLLAAYERTLLPQPARFDRYVASLDDPEPSQEAPLLSDEEIAGLRIFIGQGACTQCHNGPRLTNDAFHNTAVPGAPGVPLQPGRVDGVAKVQADPFNCLGPYSDAAPEQCTALRFMVTDPAGLVGSMKTPTLRNVAETAPYMHTGQFATLAEVVEHYNGGGYSLQGHNELKPLGLSPEEASQLAAFLRTLTAEAR
ncbi:MAG: cytochrome-c peroxidase [Caldilinea sp.]|nr:cytochrome-c peroxidase [Caldilinea sp.]